MSSLESWHQCAVLQEVLQQLTFTMGAYELSATCQRDERDLALFWLVRYTCKKPLGTDFPSIRFPHVLAFIFVGMYMRSSMLTAPYQSVMLNVPVQVF